MAKFKLVLKELFLTNDLSNPIAYEYYLRPVGQPDLWIFIYSSKESFHPKDRCYHDRKAMDLIQRFIDDNTVSVERFPSTTMLALNTYNDKENIGPNEQDEHKSDYEDPTQDPEVCLPKKTGSCLTQYFNALGKTTEKSRCNSDIKGFLDRGMENLRRPKSF